MDRIEQVKFILREEYRIKHGVDYALAYKYGKLHVLCCDVFKETIAEVVAAQALAVTTWATWSSKL